MLSLLRSNNPSLAVLNVLLIVGIRLLFFWHPPIITDLGSHSEPLSRFILHYLGAPTPATSQWWLAAGGIMCLLESLYINYLINQHKVTSRKSFVGGLVFILFTSFTPQMLYISSVHIAVAIELLLLDRLLSLNRTDKPYGNIFDLGFLSGLAMLFYFPAAALLLFVFFALYTMRAVSVRESLMVITGFVGACFAALVIYVWFDRIGQLGGDLINFPYRHLLSIKSILQSHIPILITMTIWVIISLALIPVLLFSSAIQTRKHITILLAAFILTMVATLLQSHYEMLHIMLCMPALSVFFTLYFVETKAGYISEIVFALLIVSVVVLLYSPWAAAH
jgi:hypothetical protein